MYTPIWEYAGAVTAAAARAALKSHFIFMDLSPFVSSSPLRTAFF
jgi:hypothetical protein